MTLSELKSDVPASTRNDLELSSYLQELRRKHSLILRKEESLMKKRQKVAAQINLLEKLALSADEEEAASAANQGRGLVACQSNLPLPATPAQGEESVGKLTVESMPSFEGKETSKGPRYLCVLNGCVACCLDLNLKPKQEPFSDTGYVPPIPKIATLNLLEEGLPVSGGLLKLGSHVYLIGGQEFSADAFKDPIFLSRCECLPDRRGTPNGFDLYYTLLSSYGAIGTSRGTYR